MIDLLYVVKIYIYLSSLYISLIINIYIYVCVTLKPLYPFLKNQETLKSIVFLLAPKIYVSLTILNITTCIQ